MEARVELVCSVIWTRTRTHEWTCVDRSGNGLTSWATSSSYCFSRLRLAHFGLVVARLVFTHSAIYRKQEGANLKLFRPVSTLPNSWFKRLSEIQTSGRLRYAEHLRIMTHSLRCTVLTFGQVPWSFILIRIDLLGWIILTYVTICFHGTRFCKVKNCITK